MLYRVLPAVLCNDRAAIRTG